MKNKKGFTLSELIVALVLGVVLLASLIPFLTMAQKGAFFTQETTRLNQVGDSIYQYIGNLLKDAEEVYLGDNDSHKPADPENWNAIAVSPEGLLTVNGNTLYDEAYQEKCTLVLTATGSDRNRLTLGVALQNQADRPQYEKTSAFVLQNLAAAGFGQTQGIVGVPLLSNVTSQTNPDTAKALVIWFQSASTALLEFDPGATTPTLPTPNPDELTVVLPKTLSVPVKGTAELISYVSLPAGATNVRYTWDWGTSSTHFSHATLNPTPTGHTLTGILATVDFTLPVTLTVTCQTPTGAKSASDVCQVTVGGEQSENGFGLYIATDHNYYEHGGWVIDITGDTLLFPLTNWPRNPGDHVFGAWPFPSDEAERPSISTVFQGLTGAWDYNVIHAGTEFRPNYNQSTAAIEWLNNTAATVRPGDDDRILTMTSTAAQGKEGFVKLTYVTTGDKVWNPGNELVAPRTEASVNILYYDADKKFSETLTFLDVDGSPLLDNNIAVSNVPGETVTVKYTLAVTDSDPAFLNVAKTTLTGAKLHLLHTKDVYGVNDVFDINCINPVAENDPVLFKDANGLCTINDAQGQQKKRNCFSTLLLESSESGKLVFTTTFNLTVNIPTSTGPDGEIFPLVRELYFNNGILLYHENVGPNGPLPKLSMTVKNP